jgi:hypothetical protein
MTDFIRPLLLSALCALILGAPVPARAWSEMPAEAQDIIDKGGRPADCTADCPAGMFKKTVPGGVPAFDNCTDAYQYYISNGYELILTLFLQYAQAYSSDYLAACRAQTTRISDDAFPAAQRLAAQAQAEAEALPAVMRALITGRIAALVPAHCRTNKPAQDEAAAAFDEWLATTTTYNRGEIAGYIKGGNIECGQFIDTRAARIYDTDFAGTPVLGLTATLAYTRHPTEEELKKAVLDYKSAHDSLKKP